MNKKKIFAVLLLLALGVLIYSNTFHSSFQFDDYNSIVTNLNIRNIADAKAIWDFWPTRFITYVTIAFNYHFNQLNVLGYHFFNLLAHLLSAFLVWWFILLTFASPRIKSWKVAHYADQIAFFAALLFVSHPLQTESVTYIIQRATCLAALFYLATLCLYAKARMPQDGESPAARKFYYIGSILTAILAMFTKETSITLPFMVLLYENYFFRVGTKMNWKRVFPFLTLLLIIPVVMVATKSVNVAELHRVSEAPPGIAPVNYFLTQLKVIVTYLCMMFVPFNQNIDHDYPLANSLLQPQVIASAMLIAGILIVGFLIRSKYRLLSFCIFWFFLVLLPESSVLPIADVICEHRLYLPMVGYSIFLITAFYLFWGRGDTGITTLVLIGIVAFYSVSAYSRNFYWKNEFSLWNDAILKSPGKVRAYNERGIAYVRAGNYEKALDDFNIAMRLNPNYHLAYYNRAIVYKNQGDYDLAIADYKNAIRINPKYFDAFNNLGTTYAAKSDTSDAILSFSRAIELNPYFAQAYYNRATAYASQGNYDKAESDYAKAKQINPVYDRARLK
jgi:hypothetical protein